MKIKSIHDVARGQMCTGCGACAYISPHDVEMIDVLDHGRRPRAIVNRALDPDREKALRVCPGIHLEHDFDLEDESLITELLPAWGPVRELWEGFASDDQVRFLASSGGAATALACYCIEKQGMAGTLHIKARDDVPYLNRTVLSRSREELVQGCGSRYAPASPCDGLQMIEDAKRPCVFIGKPCDVAAVQKARRLRPALEENVGLTIAIFCAGTPTTRGTLEMLEVMNADPSKVTRIRYRGWGWPGRAAAYMASSDTEDCRELSYEESWGAILEKHRQWRCHLCLDHSGEFADIAVGDPWYRDIRRDEPGLSLVLARTELGHRILGGAREAGYLKLERRDPWVLPASQGHFVPLRGRIWGRILILRLLGLPVPRYVRLPMFRFYWSGLNLWSKARVLLGTLRRVLRRKLWRSINMEPMSPEAASHTSSRISS